MLYHHHQGFSKRDDCIKLTAVANAGNKPNLD